MLEGGDPPAAHLGDHAEGQVRGNILVGKPGWAIEYSNTDVIARSGRFSVLTGKTGYTDLALYCLAIAVRMSAAQSHDVAMVFLGAAGKMTRFADFQRTAQWLTEHKWKSTAAADANSSM